MEIEKILARWLKPLKKELPPLYLVGGSVRDHILRRKQKDIDLICDDAENVARGIADANKAAFVPFRKKPEEPCFRVVNRGNPEDFLDVSPIRGGSPDADLRLRDFTINSVAIRIGRGGVLRETSDPTGGIADLERKTIKMTGPEAFVSDPLRMLRAVRFAATLGFDVDESTTNAVKTHAGLIKNTASERILHELFEIFKADRVHPFVCMMDELGILETIIPEIGPMKGCGQNSYHHLDVWNHSLAALESIEPVIERPSDFFGPDGDCVKAHLESGDRAALLKIGVLLHDTGKPETRNVDAKTGRVTFYGHNETGAQIVSQIARRLRMSKQSHDFLHFLVKEHVKILFLSKPDVKRSTIIRWFRKYGEDVVSVLVHGIADTLSIRGPESSDAYRESLLRWIRETAGAYYQSIKPSLEQKNLVNGDDLIALGMTPGPELGRVLQKVREAQDAGEVRDRQSALELASGLAC